MGIVNFPTFLMAGILLNLTPGTDTMYILGRSISQGKRAGICSALGIGSGCLVHTMLAAFGLSVIIARSPFAFNAVKLAGAAYLLYLGIRLLVAKPSLAFVTGGGETTGLGKIYVSGILTNVLNPKVALFFLAFLPQFVDPHHAASAVPFLILGLTFIFTGTTWCLLLAIFASAMSKQIRRTPSIKTWLDRLTGSLFVAIGIKIAFETK
jgi:threonine/homoserine/homoserine lactone efflux protein